MDKIDRYRRIILDILEERAKIIYANLDAQNEIIVDRDRDRYQLATIGWKGYKRIHTATLHFDIIDGRIWIQSDQTEHGIAHDLMERGVPKSDIILAYYLPIQQENAGFPVVYPPTSDLSA